MDILFHFYKAICSKRAKHHFLLSLLALTSIFILNSCESAKEQKPISGAWIGTVETRPFPDLVSLTIDSGAIVKLFYNEVEYQPVSDFVHEEGKVSFKIEGPVFEASFDGEYKNDSIIGLLTINEEHYSCGFVRTIPMALGETAELTGLYEVAPGHVVEASSYIIDFTLNPLLVLDFKTGKKRVAFPQSDLKFVAGQRMLSPYPSDFDLTFSRGDSGLVKLSSYPGIEKEKHGLRLKNLERKQEVTAQNGDVMLRGTITYPESEGDHPLVVYVPGSGMQARGNILDDFVKLMPYYGIATLVYDKRGCGESTGSLENYTYEDLAKDLEAVVAEASAQPGIDKDRIGLLGIDQAGLIMPMVAANSEQVKFMVNISGSILSMEEQEYRACALRMRADGFSEKEIEEAIAYQNLLFDYLKGEADSVALSEASQTVSTKIWSGYVTSFENKSYVQWWRRNYNFSAMPFLEKIDIPQLTIFGEKDLLIPVEESTQKLTAVYEQKSLKNSKVNVYSGANHLMLLGEKRGDFQYTEIEGYPEGLFDDINEWVAEITGIK
ncbi:alpha/beta hydrolase [Flammeovirgaceae bacterium SG7u.111]|nr:alpha/beta hydrolase [Flammeovirgaceae bacterium SG7u.132]WPO35035.1 alpha/beta hydrolase [Flammeovirgaceae bacterium SG7u.111]